MLQTRMEAPASGTPRELNTMWSLRELWPRLGSTTPYQVQQQRKSCQEKAIFSFDRNVTHLF